MKIKTILHHDRCPSCGKNNIIVDELIGESFCKHCGFVISENTIDAGAEWRSFAGDAINRSRVGDPTSILIHDMGLSTVIGKKNQDVTGRPISSVMKKSFERLRQQDNRIHLNTSMDKNFVQAFADINNLKTKLSLSDSIVESAAYRYRKVVERGLIKGRSIKAMVGACVYLTCRDSEVSRSLNDVAKAINVRKKELTKCYRILLVEFDLTMPPPDPLNAVSRIANIVGFSEKTKRKAIELLEKERESGAFAGKDPNGLAAAVLYIAAKIHNEVKSQEQISLAAGVTGVTLRNRMQGLSKPVLKEYLEIKELKITK